MISGAVSDACDFLVNRECLVHACVVACSEAEGDESYVVEMVLAKVCFVLCAGEEAGSLGV